MIHTPEPWTSLKVDESSTAILGPKFDGGESQLIATVRQDTPQGKGDVALIRSSPMLLRMVKDLRDMSIHLPNLDTKAWTRLLNRADLLLQYATGLERVRAAVELRPDVEAIRKQARHDAFLEIADRVLVEADRARDGKELASMHRLDRLHNYLVASV